MSNEMKEQEGRVQMQVRNIGGIDEASVQISSGVTALVGENATNRTSLLQAIAAGLGTDEYTLKSDAETGEVSLKLDDDEYTRNIRRENDHIETGGNPYLSDPDIAELYAVLLESNDVRRAVRQGANLRDLILAPVDTEQISRQISDRVDKRREIDKELDRLDRTESELADLETERDRTREDLEAVEETLEGKREQISAIEEDRDRETATVEDELDDKLATLNEVRSELERVRANIESERRSLESLQETRKTIEQQYDSLSVPDEIEIATLEERIENLRERKRSLDSTVSELQQVVRFNNERLEESHSPVREALADESDETITDGLNPSDATVTCWTCGSDVNRTSIEQMVDKLEGIREEKTQERNEVDATLQELRGELDSLESRREEWQQLESRLTTLDEKIERREQNIAEFEQREEELTERVDELEDEVQSLQESQQDRLLELQQEISELEFEREQLESELQSLASAIDKKREQLDSRSRLERRRETLSEELEELRTRIERLERDAVEEFNTHMDALIDKLGYGNLDRIWIERVESEVSKGRSTTTEREFDLHIVRQNEDGEVYEDRIDHLSESEREIVGLVVALAGYIVHDVHEKVPFMLLDSIEMIDGDRLVDLIAYIKEFVPYLVVVLLPDHARAFEKHPPSADFQTVQI